MNMPNKCVLVWSCTHLPYEHKDFLAFISCVKNYFNPDRYINLGDFFDNHAISFHTHDPDLFSPSDELSKAISKAKAWYDLFPNCDVLESNHEALAYRKMKVNGMPRTMLREWKDIIQAPLGWTYHRDLHLLLSNGETCFFAHHLGANPQKISELYSTNYICGHQHTKLEIGWRETPTKKYFHGVAGCGIDDTSLAFAYNRSTAKRPIHGCIVIIHGNPMAIPMHLDAGGRWDKQILGKFFPGGEHAPL